MEPGSIVSEIIRLVPCGCSYSSSQYREVTNTTSYPFCTKCLASGTKFSRRNVNKNQETKIIEAGKMEEKYFDANTLVENNVAKKRKEKA